MKIDIFKSVAVLPPSPPAEDPWPRVCWELTRHRGGDDEFDSMVTYYRRLIMAEVIRLKWQKNLSIDVSDWPKGGIRESKAEFRLSGRIAHALLNLVNEIFLRHPAGYRHPSVWFGEVFLEDEALGVFGSSPDRASKTQRLAQIGTENQALRTLSHNPFTRPATSLLFELALRRAEESTDIRKVLNGYIAARQEFSRHVKKGGKVYRNIRGSPVASVQGKRSKKRDSETLS